MQSNCEALWMVVPPGSNNRRLKGNDEAHELSAKEHNMEYAFTLKFKLASDVAAHDEELMSRLGDAGCTDAMVGLGLPGYVSLEFNREAASAMDAMLSAMEDVRRALPKVELVEAAPDFVGLTDIAELAGVTRQNMRKLFVSYSTVFPPPVHGGSTTVWHLAPVLEFMRTVGDYAISRTVFDVAHAAMQVNLSKEKRLLSAKEEDRISKYLPA
jgi:hypothetical protein